MANEKIVTLDNLTTYNDKIQDKITAIDERVEYLESNAGVSPTTKILWRCTFRIINHQILKNRAPHLRSSFIYISITLEYYIINSHNK